MRRTTVTSILLTTSLLCTLLIGHSLADPRANPSETERYAHRFTPWSDEWTTESEIQHGKWGIWELSRFAEGTKATPKQQRAADDLVARTSAAVLRHGWDDFAKAKADGFAHLLVEDANHYQNMPYMFDDRMLDPDRPEFPMYYALDGEPRLTGAMFFARDRSERGPQVGGPLTVWHIHTWADAQCVFRELIPLGVAPDSEGKCAKGESTISTAEMLHVWLIDRAKGPFSTSMVVPPDELRAALAKRLIEKGY